jgi:hypothetical protein
MDIATTIEATASLITIIGLFGGGVFALGRFKSVMDSLTKGIEKLSAVVDSHLIWAQKQVDSTQEKLHEHDIRITKLEAKDEK